MRPQADRSYRWLFWCLALVGFAVDQAGKYAVFAWLYNGGQGGYYPLLEGPDAHLLPWSAAGAGADFHGCPPYPCRAAFGLRAEFTKTLDPGSGWLSPLRTWGGAYPYLPHVNKGALFGWGNAGDWNLIFLLISLAAAAAITAWSVRARRPEFILCLSLGLILAGTLGNLYDRAVFSGVRDFLHWDYLVNWPVFNLADCCLVCGAGLLLSQAMGRQPQQADQAAAAAGAAHPAPPGSSVAPAALNGQVRDDASAPGNCGVV